MGALNRDRRCLPALGKQHDAPVAGVRVIPAMDRLLHRVASLWHV